MKHKLLPLLVLASVVSCSGTDYAAYVDPFIGTGGHGHVFVGASVPFGAVQLGPTSIPRDWDWCSGYHDSDSSVIGFSFTHISGTGIGDLCDINVLPAVGNDIVYTREGIADFADRSHEVCTPGYYSVPLLKSGVLCEMTATDNCGLLRFTFPDGAQDKSLIFNLQDGGNTDSDNVDAGMELMNGQHAVGFRYSHGWAADQKLYFAVEMSDPVAGFAECENNYFRIALKDSVQTVTLKLSISPVSATNAIKNLDAQTLDAEFDDIKTDARKAWNNELAKIDIKTDNEQARKIFYTCFYHSMMEPAHFSDAGKPVRFTTLSLWDVYRAWVPLFTILHPEKVNDYIATFLDIYNKQGKLPIWHLWGNETNCMIGTPAIPIVADAILKGFDGFDVRQAYEAMRASAMNPERGQGLRMELGFIPSGDFPPRAPVSYDMEYALSDWSLAQAAKKLGYSEDYDYFTNRSKLYKKHFDPGTGFMRGLTSDGKWSEPFNPAFSNHFNSDYCEGNAWQYTWLVPHDFEGLCECFKSYGHYSGEDTTGREALIQKLDSLFIVDSEIPGENASPDISGMIGQYAHGNEPSHHTVYMYCYAQQPYKTADLVRKICTELYTASPDGICGNEDCGQMSAWYMLSAMGFYQIEPCGGRYFFGTPLFEQMKIRVSDAKTLVIKADGLSQSAKYIRSVKLNGKPYTKAWIDYADIMNGGELEYGMSCERGTWY